MSDARDQRCIWILLLALFCVGVQSAQPSCPPLSASCTCSQLDNGQLSVYCEDIILSTLFKDLGTLPLEALRIVRCNQPVLDILPFGRIRSLEISDCNISSIAEEIFRPQTESLEQLHLVNNSLSTVPLFGNLPKLLLLNLNGNQLTDVAERSLDGLVGLKQLRLKGNRICSLSKNSLNETKASLELLDLSNNCLKTVPAPNLRNSANLMHLDLSSNKIEEINNFELMNLPVLRELRLNDNLLHRINTMAFMNVPNLQYLYLRDNLIGSLDGSRLQAFKLLRIVDVTKNMLLKLPTLKDLTSLEQAIFDGNLIERVDTLSFSNNPRLWLISIQNNNIAQISRNSFDQLDRLSTLLLANNSIKAIERGMLDGMRNLQKLSLRNNSLTVLDRHSFVSLPLLTTIDLAQNRISKISNGTFAHQEKMFWLDLSNNRLSGFEKGTFNKAIANILLDGNPFYCDDSFDWVVQYLVVNHVRTFLPFQPEVTCSGPEKFVGVRLKDLMIKKANETINEGIKTLGLDSQSNQKSLLTSFLPNLGNMQSLGQAASGIPVLNTISQAIPSLRTIPGFGGASSGNGAQYVPMNRDLNSAMEQFTAPLVRFATGGQPVASDIEQLISSIPNLIVNVPGFGDVDISKLDPNMLSHVLKGGQIPGIPKETLDAMIKQVMRKVHDAAAAAQSGQPLKDGEKFLPPLEKLPREMVTSVMQGEALPGLDAEQTKTIREYYTQRMVVGDAEGGTATISHSSGQGMTLNTQAMELLKLLPPNYDITKIPQAVLAAVSRGEIPDMSSLPSDLIEHFKTHMNDVMALFKNSPAARKESLDDLLAKLPTFEKPVLSTFSPYDINALTNDMVHEEEAAEHATRMRLYTALALALVAAVTVVVLAVFVVYIRKHRNLVKNRTFGVIHNLGAPMASSTMRHHDPLDTLPTRSSQLHHI